MEPARLIEGLTRPEAYPHRPGSVELRQTHLSIVFLAGDVVYKVKKPAHFGFVDFSTLEARRLACFEEVRLNRRLAPEVYAGVVPVVESAGGLFFEREGEPVEWAVKMRRLPDECSLSAKLARGELTREILEQVAERIATFHASAHRSAEAARLARSDAVRENAVENFREVAASVGETVSERVLARLEELSDAAIARLAPLIDSRADRALACDGHGDLRLEHIYVFSEEAPPNDVVVIDCVEFSERFRAGDPVSDVAFTVMELLFHGRGDLARAFGDSYFRQVGDEEGRALLSYYIAYRSIVRAKVRGLELRERQIPEERRVSSRARARAHFLLALGELEEPGLRPALVLIGGLPGTGKSTLARAVAESCGFEVIRSDVVRKELAGVSAETPAADDWQAGIYTEEWTARTYAECLRRVEAALFEGRRVIVDASFADENLRQTFVRAARALCVPVVWFVCQAPPDRVRQRLAARRGDASDADAGVYERARRSWTPAGRTSAAILVEIDTELGEAQAVRRAVTALRERNLG